MSLIANYDDLIKNTKALEKERANSAGVGYGNYLSLIRKGRVFLPYLAGKTLAFGPSRFLGYTGNTVASHMTREDRDGRQTTPRISQVLCEKTDLTINNGTDADAESYFMQFCKSLNVVPDNAQRTYWITPSIASWLDEHTRIGKAMSSVVDQENEVMNNQSVDITTREAIVQARVGQGLFRRRTLAAYERCLVTGIKEQGLLIASHIKPWRDCRSNADECLNPDNALLLSPTWDRLFDRGFISFSDSGQLLVGRTLSTKSRKALGIVNLFAKLTPGQRLFMSYHRDLHKFG